MGRELIQPDEQHEKFFNDKETKSYLLDAISSHVGAHPPFSHGIKSATQSNFSTEMDQKSDLNDLIIAYVHLFQIRQLIEKRFINF